MARPREFDSDTVLLAALQVFFEKGYDGTSISHLVEAMRLNRASLYAAFGDKQKLFTTALAWYQQAQAARIDAMIHDAPSPRDAITRIVMDTLQPNRSCGGRGCFIVNTGVELGGRDPAIAAVVLESLTAAQRLFEDLLQQAGCDRRHQRAGELLAVQVGLHVLARAGLPNKRLREIACTSLERILA